MYLIKIIGINTKCKSVDLIFSIMHNENTSFLVKFKTSCKSSINLEQEKYVSLENYPDAEFEVLSRIIKNHQFKIIRVSVFWMYSPFLYDR